MVTEVVDLGTVTDLALEKLVQADDLLQPDGSEPQRKVRPIRNRYLRKKQRDLNHYLCWGSGGAEGNRTLDLLNAIQAQGSLAEFS